MQADKIDTLEVEQNWKEEEFDFVLQFLRTILMKREHRYLSLCRSHTYMYRWRFPDLHI